MKTIVLIENDIVELESLVAIFKKWQKEINILTAREEEAAINIISTQQVDLIVCNLSLPGKNELEGISRLTTSFPFVPCIAIASKGRNTPSKAVKMGASRCLKRPLETEQLLNQVTELLELSSSGTIKGIPIHSFLQMLETERKTCTLLVHTKEETGILYIRNGELIGAETPTLRNEDAVHAILTWEEAVIEIKYLNDKRKQEINKPLITLIFESFQLKDEREKKKDGAAAAKSSKGEAQGLTDKLGGADKPPQLKHISTVGSRIALDIGAKIELEIKGVTGDVSSIVVGLLQDRYLIVTTPTPYKAVEKALDSNVRIVVRYIHAGKVCMFKSQVLRAIDSPSHLLFLDYPQVIHFHELRKAKRTTIFIPCTLHLHSAEIFYGILVDLSFTGALCMIKLRPESPVPRLDIGDEVQLSCLLPGFKEEQEIQGIVRNFKKNNQEIRIGIEFSNLQNYLRETIEHYLYSIEQFSS